MNFGTGFLKPGAALEHLIIQKTKNAFKGKKKLGDQVPLVKTEKANCLNKAWCWKSPKDDSLPVEFCRETSIHGVKFVVRKESHLLERIFWSIATILCFIAAVLLINDVWERYHANPVIVSFEPTEQSIDKIPFPAVTLCNINKFKKSTVDQLIIEAREGTPDDPDGKNATKRLAFIRNVCNAQQSFAKEFDFAGERGLISDEDLPQNFTISEDDQLYMLDFIMDYTISCKDMIHLCMFAENLQNCSNIFKPIITDYGKCCTFNILPYPLLMKDPRSNSSDPMTSEFIKDVWSPEELKKWSMWDYSSQGMFVPENLERPYRQFRAGVPYGLSVLIDPHMDEYFCPASDSYGFRFAIHLPLEMPHVAEFGNILEIGKEIYVEVNPDLINADDDVKAFEQHQQKCYFNGEKTLSYFQPYTATNCYDECTAKVITANCSCSYFYMPREDNVKVCNTAKSSDDHTCIDKAKVGLLETLKDTCGYCNGLCENLDYNFQTTTADMQASADLWGKPTGNATEPSWKNNKMSIVHIFYGSDSTVPKLRKRLYGPTDLIAATGGLLGLCLGVSILSLVEAIYYFTIRPCFKVFGRRTFLAKKFINAINNKRRNRVRAEREIQLDPNMVPFYNYNGYYHSPKSVQFQIPTFTLNPPYEYKHEHQQ